jgi:hypothetical protein
MRKRRITFRRNVNGDDGDPTEEELADWVGVGENATPASKTVAQNSDKPLRPCRPVVTAAVTTTGSPFPNLVWNVRVFCANPKQLGDLGIELRRGHMPWRIASAFGWVLSTGDLKVAGVEKPPAAKSRRPSRVLGASGPMPCSTPAMASSAAGACNLRCSRCATRFLRSIPLVNIPRSEGYISY